MATVLLEAKPYRPFKSSEEYLEAMKEDLAEWLNIMYPELNINAENFMTCLDTGVALCKHANNVRNAAEEYLAKRQARNKSMTRSITSGLAGPILANLNVHYLPAAKSGTFFARDNVSNFITWCRKSLKILECLLFETDDLIMRKNEKHVILCLLEVARRGAKFGMLAPMLVQMERQIDREIAADYKANGSKFILQTTDDDINQKSIIQEDMFEDSDSEDEIEEPMLLYGPQPQIITNDLKSLDEMVRDLVEKCTCPSQFPMVRVSEGKYRIGDTKVLIFVRILRSHVMVRVGGGWDTLAHYLDKHDPCRCRSAHRTSVAARLIPRISNQNSIELHRAQVIYERSPPATRKTFNSLPFTFSNLPQINNTASPTSLLTQNKSRSPTPQKKFIHQQQNTQNGNGSYLLSTSPIANLNRRSMSPSPRKITDIRKKQTTFDTSNQLKIAVDMPSITNNYVQDNLSQTPTIITKEEFSPPNNFPEVQLNTGLNKSGSNYDNTSDNGSEISDEGYRSLGLQQINNQKYELHQNLITDDAEYKARPYQNACDSQLSSKENRNKINDNIKNVGSNTEKIDTVNLSPLMNEQRKIMIKTEFDNNDYTNVDGCIDINTFEQSGIFITDDDITVDIAGATGLRKTGFSNKIYGGPDDLSYLCPKTIEEKPILGINKPEILAKIPINNSKIPRSPKITRRRSVDVSGEKNNFISNGNSNGFNRMQPEYRSNRLVKQLSSDDRPYQSKTTIINTGTWNGRNKKKLYPGLNEPPARSSSLNSHFDKKSKQVNSHILYDSNGKRVSSKSTSLTTSPVKSKNINSPLAQQLLKVANNAKNDAQMLEKMKIILQKYGNESSINNCTTTTTTITTIDKKTPKNFNCNNSYTSEWVHNNGDLNRSDSSLSSAELRKSNEINKNNSPISVTPLELKNCKNISILNSNNSFTPITPKSRLDHRGLSKIPAPIRRNTELY